MTTYAGIELGGTKIVCGIGTGDGELLERVRIETDAPEVCVPAVQKALEELAARQGAYQAIGIGSFGPVSLDPRAADYGRITTAPKIRWRGTDLVRSFDTGVPLALDTDVAAAALAEARWGAAAGCGSVVYITVGTGIGAGILVDGRPVHGMMHPEVGHIRVPRLPHDEFAGLCPHHRDCIEGMTAGPAISARWGAPLNAFPADHPAFSMTARYLAQLVCQLLLVLCPEKIILGGGVMSNRALFPLIHAEVQALLNGYLALEQIETHVEQLIVPPALGDDAGVLGAIRLAVLATGSA